MQSLVRHRWTCPVSLATLALFLTLVNGALALDWPQWFGPERDGVWREKGLIEKFPDGGPTITWRTPLGTGYSGPAVVGDRVYVLDRVRAVDADGKPLSGKNGIQGKEGLVCLNADDGKVIWRHDYDCVYKVSYPSGPRTTPVIQDNRVYAIGAMGDLFCLEADTGKPVWTKNLVKEYKVDPTPVWGYAAHLLLDGDLLYSLVGGEGSAVVAFDKKTGKEVWKALTAKEICYSPPMIFEAGGKRQLLIWHDLSVNSLDPATGKPYWEVPYPEEGKPQRPCVNVATLRRDGQFLLLSSTYHGPMMLKLAQDKPEATVLWRKEPKVPTQPEGLCCLMSTPVLKDGYVYGIGFDGALICLEAETGKEQWQTYALMDGSKSTDCGTAFLVPQGDRCVIFTEKGDLVLATLSPKEYKEISRAHVIEPLESARGRKVVWSHPAFAHQSVFVRNDKEIIRVDMAAKKVSDDSSKGDTAKDDLEKMKGEWTLVSTETDGKKRTAEDFKEFSRTINGDTYTVTVETEEGVQTIGVKILKLDPSKSPRTIDVTMTDGPSKDKTFHGIYKFEGDTQVICLAGPDKERPDKFDSKQGTITVWKRVKTPDKGK